MKKIVAFLLAAAMLSVSLAGCQSRTDGDGQATAPDDGDSATTQPADDGGSEGGKEGQGTYKPVPSGDVAVSGPGVLPIVENRTDITVYIQQNANVENMRPIR